MIDTTAIRVGTWFQGPTGSGQGGWTAHRLATAIGEPVTVAIRRPIPLDIDMTVIAVDDGWHLVDPAQPSEPEYSSFFYEAGNEAEEASSSSAPALEASGTILASTLVRLVIFAGRRPTQMYGRTLSS